MTDPDELYTLRAQYWLGHYNLAIEESRSLSRRPMNAVLKAERDEFLARAHIALGQFDKVMSDETEALQALKLKSQFDAANGNEARQTPLVDRLKSMLGSSSSPSVHLTASQVLLAAGQTKEALQAIHTGTTMEQLAMMLQIYLKLDRLDLAKQQLKALRTKDEDSILTQLGSVYVSLATGSTAAPDAVHVLTALSEQYGPSPVLLNLMACALLQQGDYVGAQQKLEECLKDHPEVVLPDTILNLITALVQQNLPVDAYVTQMKQQYPTHPFCAGLDRFVGAFEREAVKYKV